MVGSKCNVLSLFKTPDFAFFPSFSKVLMFFLSHFLLYQLQISQLIASKYKIEKKKIKAKDLKSVQTLNNGFANIETDRPIFHYLNYLRSFSHHIRIDMTKVVVSQSGNGKTASHSNCGGQCVIFLRQCISSDGPEQNRTECKHRTTKNAILRKEKTLFCCIISVLI